jgi:hypothetical protein
VSPARFQAIRIRAKPFKIDFRLNLRSHRLTPRRFTMGRYDDHGPAMPPRIKAAFEFIHHARMVTEQTDTAIPMRPLTALERSVEFAALRTIQQYLLGEMDFSEPAQTALAPEKDDDESARDSPA